MDLPVAENREAGTEAKLYQVAYQQIVKRISMLPEERRRDLIELMGELKQSDKPSDRKEVAQTMMEIIMPELIGDLVMEPPMRSDGKFLSARAAWIGARIKEFREAKEVTQAQLAKESGIPQPHISKLEAGKHSPSNETLRRIAKALGVDVHKLDYEEHS